MKKFKFLKGWGIFIGFVVGGLIGLLFNYFEAIPLYIPFAGKVDIALLLTDHLFLPVGDLFLQSLRMIIVPLVFSSLIVGVGSISSSASIGRHGRRLFLFYTFSTFIAIFIGQIMMGTFKPGNKISPEKRDKIASLMNEKMSSIQQKSSMVGSSLWPGILTKIVPRNIIKQFGEENMLAVIFVSILFGLSLLYMPKGPPKSSVINFMTAFSDMSVIVIKWIMATAPYAVAALIAVSFAHMGLDLVYSLGQYILVMAGGMLIHLFISYSFFLKFLVKIPLIQFFARIVPVWTTAFSTSSSAATMPVTMGTLENRLGAPRGIVSFSIPIGVTVNMDGTALFEVAAALFIAQAYGIPITISGAALLVAIVFITSVGIAGVPGGSIPILMSSIVILGLPPEGIALILGVDRLLDMGRTVVNVTGDSVAALYLSRKEGVDLKGYLSKNP